MCIEHRLSTPVLIFSLNFNSFSSLLEALFGLVSASTTEKTNSHECGCFRPHPLPRVLTLTRVLCSLFIWMRNKVIKNSRPHPGIESWRFRLCCRRSRRCPFQPKLPLPAEAARSAAAADAVFGENLQPQALPFLLNINDHAWDMKRGSKLGLFIVQLSLFSFLVTSRYAFSLGKKERGSFAMLLLYITLYSNDSLEPWRQCRFGIAS